MKKAMKKLMAALLAVAMVCAMAIPAFAASGSSSATKGSITISNAVKDETYTLYKMFDLNSFDTQAGTYSYTVVSDWENFFLTDAEGAQYITLKNGHPTWIFRLHKQVLPWQNQQHFYLLSKWGDHS